MNSTLYCPIPNFQPEEISSKLLENLQKAGSNNDTHVQMLQVLQQTSSHDASAVITKFGEFSTGSVLSYQLPKPEKSSTIMHTDSIQFPDLKLPDVASSYCSVLSFSETGFGKVSNNQKAIH